MTDPVVLERLETEGGPLHSFDQIFDRVSRAIRDIGSVPGDDLVFPSPEGPAERPHFDRVVGVGHVVQEPLQPLERHRGIGMGVELTHSLLPVRVRAIPGSTRSGVGSVP